ncbi:predicted protein [Chaetoceros tenuissimus]|uniref:F-box domain-containing protein n=1 Tax=Chaetoceros tenuissimus TaxID=426638 RepID=A0AAD3CRV6_9STRA|nr:predicted protein [Chaetoceros tenuissimus]
MSEEHLLGATSRISWDYERNVTEPIEFWRSRANDPNLSEEERNESRASLEKWSQPNVLDILQCRHFTFTSNVSCNFFLSDHGPNCYRKEKSLIETYKEVPRGPQGFTLPTDDHLMLHLISFLDYYTAHKMTLVSKRFKGIMHTFKSMRSKEMLSYDEDNLDYPYAEVKKFVEEENSFDFNPVKRGVWDYIPPSPEEERSTALRKLFLPECMEEYSSFSMAAIEDKILEHDEFRHEYIPISEHDTYYLRIKNLSRHQVTLQEAWTLFVERIIVDSDRYKPTKVPRRYLLWSLLVGADPSSIYLSHIHVGCCKHESINVHDHIALSFFVSGQRVEIVGKIRQGCCG